MENQLPDTMISEKELAIKKMGLSLKKDRVTNVNLANGEKRKQLWDKWKTSHLESTKTWRIAKAQDPKTLRCQVPVVIKEVSTTILSTPETTPPPRREELIEPATLERSDSVYSDISDIETQVSPSDARNISENIYPVPRSIEELQSVFMLDPLLNSSRHQEEDNHRDALGSSEIREVEISELYINDDFQAEWSKTNLMATTIPIEPFPVRVPSETNRTWYEVTNFYEFVPEKNV